MFEPPRGMLFQGSFEEAKAAAQERERWLVSAAAQAAPLPCPPVGNMPAPPAASEPASQPLPRPAPVARQDLATGCTLQDGAFRWYAADGRQAVCQLRADSSGPLLRFGRPVGGQAPVDPPLTQTHTHTHTHTHYHHPTHFTPPHPTPADREPAEHQSVCQPPAEPGHLAERHGAVAGGEQLCALPGTSRLALPPPCSRYTGLVHVCVPCASSDPRASRLVGHARSVCQQVGPLPVHRGILGGCRLWGVGWGKVSRLRRDAASSFGRRSPRKRPPPPSRLLPADAALARAHGPCCPQSRRPLSLHALLGAWAGRGCAGAAARPLRSMLL